MAKLRYGKTTAQLVVGVVVHDKLSAVVLLN